MNESKILTNEFKINEYPTYILVDPKGKIIFRDTGVDGFEKLEKKLQTIGLIQENK
jgi:hypothetical protein